MGIAGISHITLSSSDVDAAVRFYSQVLDFEVIARWAAGAYLVGDGGVWLALVADPAESRYDDVPRVAVHLHAHDLDGLARRVRASGAALCQPGGTEGDALCFSDPDGHRVEIHATTLCERVEAAAAQPWDGWTLDPRALERARPSPSVPDPRKPRRLACAPVGVFVVVVDDRDRVLVLREPTTGRLEVPNGAMEPAEDPADTARRELREEAGASLEVGPMRCYAAFNVEYHPHLPPLVSVGFVCAYRFGTAVAGDDMAGCEVDWLTMSDLMKPELAIPADPDVLAAAITVLRATT
jgi:8-oxo-dGTP pyrophosphatase MutT (NUDIX family)/predicted enzyme related to lactoylglutathione lyase